MDPNAVDPVMSRHIMHCFYQQKAHASLIRTVSDPVCRRDKPEGAVFFQRLAQFPQPVRAFIGKYDLVFIPVLELFRNTLVSRPFRIFPDFTFNRDPAHFISQTHTSLLLNNLKRMDYRL